MKSSLSLLKSKSAKLRNSVENITGVGNSEKEVKVINPDYVSRSKSSVGQNNENKKHTSSGRNNSQNLDTNSKPLPKWKIESENFRKMMKLNRRFKSGEIPADELNFIEDPSLIHCPHCSRKFSPKAADRHIPICNTIIAKPVTLLKGSRNVSRKIEQNN